MELPSPMYLGAGGTDHSQIGYDPHLNGGLSLQEMIDSDIKADFDDVLQSNPLSFPVSVIKKNIFKLVQFYDCAWARWNIVA